jgi:hypothetical protein
MAVITDIADAVVEELNGHTFSQSFEAQRHYRPLVTLPEMASLHVSVVPKAVSIERLDRTSHQEDYQVDVAIQKKVDAVDNTTLDPLTALVQEVADFLRDLRLSEVWTRSGAALPSAICVAVRNEPIYAPEHLDDLRQFTSVLTLTYRVVR